MAYLCVDGSGYEWIFEFRPIRKMFGLKWSGGECNNFNLLPKGSIAKLIGKELTWDDEPYELKNE